MSEHRFNNEEERLEELIRKDSVIEELRVSNESLKAQQSELQESNQDLGERVAKLSEEKSLLQQHVSMLDNEISRLIGNYHSPARTGNLTIETPGGVANQVYALTSEIEEDLRGLHARVEEMDNLVGLNG